MVQERNAAAFRTSGRPQPRRGAAGGSTSMAPPSHMVQSADSHQSNRDFGKLVGLPPVTNGAPPPGGFPPPRGPGPGPGGGGGGGGASGPSPEEMAAFRSILDRYAQPDPMTGAFDLYDQSQRDIYNAAPINARHDATQNQVGAAGVAGKSNMDGILQELLAREIQGRAAVQGSIQQGDQRLQDVARRFGGMSQGASQNVNDVLNNLGAGPMADGGFQNNLNALFANGQMTNQSLGNTMDASMADRPTMFAGFNADIQGGMAAQQQGLMNQIAARRSTELQANDAALRQSLAQSGITRAQSEQNRQASADQIRVEMARLGITV